MNRTLREQLLLRMHADLHIEASRVALHGILGDEQLLTDAALAAPLGYVLPSCED